MSTVVAHKKRPPTKPERRKTQRQIAYARFPVSVYLVNDEPAEPGGVQEPVAIGIITDLSPAGAGLILDRCVKSGTQVVLALTTRTRQVKELKARIIWTNTLPTTGHVIKPDTDASVDFWRQGSRFDREDKDQLEQILLLMKSMQG